MKLLLKLFSIGLLLSSLNVAAGSLYKWVDENGVVQYTQYPPPKGQTEIIKTKPAPSSAAGAKRQGLSDLVDSADKTQEQKQSAQATAAETKAKKEQRAKDCQNLQRNLQIMKNSGRVAQTQTDGSRKMLSTEEHTSKIKSYESLITKNCN